MYLFSRSTVLASNEGLEWAVGMTEHAKRASGLEVELWGQTWSREYGRVAWTAFAPDLATLAAAGDAIASDAAMSAAGEQGATLTNGGLEDGLVDVVFGSVDPSAPPAEYVTSVATVCANGSLRRGVATGIEIAQRAEKVTGVPTMFGTSVTGVYGGVVWLTGHPDVKSLEAAQQAFATDEDWLAFIDEAAGAYTQDRDATQSIIHRRLA